MSRLSATEDAATMTSLCIDRTGTLTENRLSVQEIIPAENFAVNDVIQYAVLASVAANNDPIDMALIKKADTEYLNFKGYQQISFTAFTAAAKRTEAVVQKRWQAIHGIKPIIMVGIGALIDPPLPDSVQMIAKIKELGVKVKMPIGDALPIAKEIAIQVGAGDDIVSASLIRKDPNAYTTHRGIIVHNGFA